MTTMTTIKRHTHACKHTHSERERKMEMKNKKNYESTTFKPQWDDDERNTKAAWQFEMRRFVFDDTLIFKTIWNSMEYFVRQQQQQQHHHHQRTQHNATQIKWDEKEKTFVLIYYFGIFLLLSSLCNVLIIIIGNFNGSALHWQEWRELIKKD